MAETYRVVLTGTMNVGKTTLFHRIKDNKFKEHVGKLVSDTCTKSFTVKDANGKKREVQVSRFNYFTLFRFIQKYIDIKIGLKT